MFTQFKNNGPIWSGHICSCGPKMVENWQHDSMSLAGGLSLRMQTHQSQRDWATHQMQISTWITYKIRRNRERRFAVQRRARQNTIQDLCKGHSKSNSCTTQQCIHNLGCGGRNFSGLQFRAYGYGIISGQPVLVLGEPN